MIFFNEFFAKMAVSDGIIPGFPVLFCWCCLSNESLN